METSKLGCGEFVFSGHAVQRMFERGIRQEMVIEAIRQGEIIARYEDDQPYPSYLVHGIVQQSSRFMPPWPGMPREIGASSLRYTGRIRRNGVMTSGRGGNDEMCHL